ncbi:MAG TPA: NADH-quinone oxidoreductase subunit M, partial [Gemmatimonadales bacterium]|nr:NADH-quinone oxidoreductase subunit M [Gemmatimonadales bacterium]
QVPLESPAFGVGRLDDANARCAKVLELSVQLGVQPLALERQPEGRHDVIDPVGIVQQVPTMPEERDDVRSADERRHGAGRVGSDIDRSAVACDEPAVCQHVGDLKVRIGQLAGKHLAEVATTLRRAELDHEPSHRRSSPPRSEPVLLAPVAAARRIALAVSLAEFLLSVGLWWALDTEPGTLQLTASVPWISAWGISYAVGIDGISLMMVLLTTLLMPLCIVGSWRYITERERGYYALLLVLLTGVIGVFIATDLFLFYVFWEVMLIPMYFIIGMWGGRNRLYAAIKFFLFTMAGSLLMLIAIVGLAWVVAARTGTLSFAYQHLLQHADLAGELAPWFFGAFALAFAIKVPVFPLHTWLPDAHVEAPTAGSVILASVLLKMGAYGFIRFAIPFFPTVAIAPVITNAVLVLAVIGIIYGALVAMVQTDIKKLVAYSSVSHLGFVMLGIWAATMQSIQGAIMIMIAHGFSTGALFFLVGMLYERRHTREISAFGGIARVVPGFSLVFSIVALSSIGLPGLNGFIGEFLVLLGAMRTQPLAAILATSGVVFAAAYLLWALQRIIYNRLEPENASLPDLSRRELVVLVPLLLGIVWLGLYPNPVLRRIEPATTRYLERVRGQFGPLDYSQAASDHRLAAGYRLTTPDPRLPAKP